MLFLQEDFAEDEDEDEEDQEVMPMNVVNDEWVSQKMLTMRTECDAIPCTSDLDL